MNVQSIDSLDYITVHNILTSNRISDSQKKQFLINNKAELIKMAEAKITMPEFRRIMKNRKLFKFRPLKNSYTKLGDKRLLSELLEIPPNEVSSYIENVSNALQDIEKLSFLPKNKLEAIKTYVYRHGSKDQVVNFLNYELKNSTDVLKTLYRTLEYHTDGIADYFIRPIHRMDNNTLIRLYNVVDKNLDAAQSAGIIEAEQRDEISHWALIKIYRIQNNSKFINAVKTYKELKS